MENPWKKLSKENPYVLAEDKLLIDAYNKDCSDDFRIRTDLIPEPFIGNINAPIVLLSLNPGVGEDDEKIHKQNWFIEELFSNLNHSINKYPFYFLNPEFEKTPGGNWWIKKLKEILKLVNKEKLANNILVVEYFPYHSEKYKKMPIIPSQKYSFYLVKEAIKRNAEIIIMRSEKQWLKAVPELEKVEYYTLKNKQAPYLSNNNLVKIKQGNYVEELYKKIF
jgi:hypothetical protein